MTEADIRLSADFDSNEQRAAEPGKNCEFACFLTVRKFGKQEASLVFVSLTISSVTHANALS
jgi:hypothetical protein